jgi:CubicO group peptidase (beta-lactamase class C family)
VGKRLGKRNNSDYLALNHRSSGVLNHASHDLTPFKRTSILRRPMNKLLFTLLIFLFSATTLAQATLPTELVSKVDAFVTERMVLGKLPGLSLVIVKDGQVTYTKGYGFANIEKQIAMTDHTRVAIGSTTKGMTALAVMQLVEQGKLDLDAPVENYVPWFSVDDPHGDDITLRHLLTHTSGLPASAAFDGNREPDALEQHVRSLATTKLQRTPGSEFEYANDGYAVAGLVVQEVSGMPYADYMTKFIFAPLGMQDATFDFTRAEAEGMAQGYIRQRSSFVPRPLLVSQGFAPAGTLLTSASDVGNYLAALLNGGEKVISEGSLEEMWKPQATIGDGTQYGFGWVIVNLDGLELITHDGSVEVSGSIFVIVPSQKLAVGVLTNFSNGHTNEIGKGITTLLLGGEPEPSQEPVLRDPSTFTANPDVWQPYVGDYETHQGLVHIYADGNKLLGQAGDVTFELEAYGDNDFVLRGEIGALEGHGVSFNVEVDKQVTFILDGQAFGQKQ